MKKAILFFSAMLFLALCMQAKADRIQFSTSLYADDPISLIIKGSNCWIDLNGNGQRDANEALDGSGDRVQTKRLEQSANINIYGDNITKFVCRSKELTELNLSLAPDLIELICSNNEIKVLDLSANTKLTSLNLRQNKLKRLDLSTCKLIENINCSENQIAQLILPDAPKALTDLDCSGNRLKMLNLTACTALNRLYCSANELTTIASLNVATVLSRLTCADNKLTSLDLSTLLVLKELDCATNNLTELVLAKNPHLTILDCSSNKLTSLDLSSLAALTKVKIFRNSIDYDAMDALLSGLNKTTGEKTITVIDTRASNTERNVCANTSVSKARAKGWTIYDFRGGLEDGENLYEGTENALPTEQIVMISTRIGGEKIELTIEGQDCWIDLNANDRKDADEELESGQLQTKIIDGNADKLTIYGRNITSFSCWNHKLTYLNTTKVPKLKSLICHGNWISTLDLSSNTALTKLICSGNRLSELNLSALTQLSYLNCSVNSLQELKLNKLTSLVDLDCSANKLPALDLTHNVLLQNLACDNNQIQTLDLSPHKALLSLSCYTNAISASSMTALIKSLPPVTAGEFFAVDTKNKDEVNACSTTDVAQAKAKGWITYDFGGGKNGGKNPYPGFQDAPTSERIALSTARSEGKTISLALSGQDCWIDLNANNAKDPGEELSGDWSKPAEIKTLTQNSSLNIYGKNITQLFLPKNELTTLDLTRAPMLVRVDCYENKLSELYIAHSNKIEQLDCSNNELNVLDLSKASELRRLFCGQNQLSTLDMSECTKLSTVSFSSNQVPSVDLSPLTNLDSLYCAHNRLSRLDVSACSKLSLLSCFDNRLNDEAMTKLVSALNQNPSAVSKPKELFVIDTKNSQERNIFTPEDVEIATGKQWKVYDFMGGVNAGRNAYAGAYATDLSTIRATVPVQIYKRGESLWLEAEKNLSQEIAVYSIDGHLLYRGMLSTPYEIYTPYAVILIKIGTETIKIIL